MTQITGSWVGRSQGQNSLDPFIWRREMSFRTTSRTWLRYVSKLRVRTSLQHPECHKSWAAREDVMLKTPSFFHLSEGNISQNSKHCMVRSCFKGTNLDWTYSNLKFTYLEWQGKWWAQNALTLRSITWRKMSLKATSVASLSCSQGINLDRIYEHPELLRA